MSTKAVASVGVAAECHLASWGEPAKPNPIAVRNEVRRLREVVLEGDVLQELILEPSLQWDYSCGIAAETALGEAST